MLPSVLSKISTSEFQITDWQSQIAELQSRIVAEQQRINRLNEDNAVADGLLQAAQAAKSKISDQEIIADIYTQLSKLFNGGDNPNNGNGNHPNPEPQPSDDGGCEITSLEGRSLCNPTTVTQPSGEGGCGDVSALITESSIGAIAMGLFTQTVEVVKEAIAVNPEPLTGQHCEWSSPWASPLASPLATPLCCQLSDAPQSALQGQSVEIACVVSDAPKKPEYIELVPVSHEVAYQRRSHDGEIICCYVGFNNKTKAKQWGEFLAVHHSVASGFQLRASERLTAFKWEIKLWGMSLKQIERCAESDLQKSPPSNFGTAPKRKVEPVAPVPKPLQVEHIEVNDIVRSTTINNWQYKVVGLRDGMFNCEQINVEAPIKVVMHPASVELVSKAVKVEDSKVSQHVSIDVNDVPVGVRLERTNDALITEYRVWAWCVVRVFGKPGVQQKSIGTLTEGTQGISARCPHGMSNPQSFQRTFDAIKYLMQGASLKLADIEAAYQQHQSEVAITPNQNQSISPEQAKADLFGGGWDVPTEQQQIEAGDWVELLITGDRYQVAEVDAEGVHLNTNDGTMLVQANEIQLLMKIPATWQPF